MSTLEQDMRRERKTLAEVRDRATRRLEECQEEEKLLQAQGTALATEGNHRGAASVERRVQKLRASARRFQDIVRELEQGGEGLAGEVLLARLQGPAVDVLVGEVERNRELLVQRATQLLKARDRHRALRQRWSELNGKIRELRSKQGLPAPRSAMVDFRIQVTPATYSQKPDGPTYRDVADLLREMGL